MFIEDYIIKAKINIHPSYTAIPSTIFHEDLHSLPFFHIRPHLQPGMLTLEILRSQQSITLCYLHLPFDGNILSGLFQKSKFQIALEQIQSGWDILPPQLLEYIKQFNQ